MSVRALSVALVLGLGLSGVAVASAASAADPGAVKLAIAVPLVVPPSAEQFLDPKLLAQYTGEHGLLTRELDAVLGRPVAIGIDPRIIVSIRLLGTSAPPSALAWLDRLETAPNQTFALNYADADATLQTQGGTEKVLLSETFDFAIDPALFAASPSAPQPTSTPTPAAPDLPTSEELASWPYTITDLAWPRDDTVISADLPKIAASGYSASILASTNLSLNAPSPTAEVDGERLLVSDAAISDALRAAASAPTPDGWTAASSALTGALAARGGVPAFATLDRAVPGFGSRLAETLDSLLLNPGVELVPLTEVAGIPSASATIVDKPQPADRVSRAGQMIQGEVAERSFASVASDPAAITSSRRLELLTLLSSQWEFEPRSWPEAADAFTTASIALRNAVHLVTSSNFLLIADNDQYLPITVENGLNQPASVLVTVRSRSSLIVIDKSTVKLRVEAGALGKVNIPVHSLSNGVVDVDVTLTSATGVAIGAPLSSEVNVQAGWETPVVIAIAALVVVVFGVGIVRTVLRRRRNSALEETGSDDD